MIEVSLLHLRGMSLLHNRGGSLLHGTGVSILNAIGGCIGLKTVCHGRLINYRHTLYFFF